MRLGLREANQRFSYAIKRVRAGETVILTERGTPIAVIAPIGKPRDDWDTAARQMAAEGLITPATKRGPMGRFRRIKVKGEPLSATLSRERDER